MNSVIDVWERVIEIISNNTTPAAIDAWFTGCEALDYSDNTLTVYAPSIFSKNILLDRFGAQVRRALFEIFSVDTDFAVITEDQMEEFRDTHRAVGSTDDSEYTFDRFVVGKSNSFAHAAALAVAKQETKRYNPLFIYGDSGLGKTHLLHDIKHEVRKNHPEYNIVYVKGDDFTNELIAAIQSGRNIEFRDKYRKADFFLMDDIQFIAGKNSTQEEFFHTFNALYEENHQIVFTSDRPPREISLLEDRILTRFEAGLQADIQPPDYETRMAIIKNKAKDMGGCLPEDVCDYIAQNMTSNVRQIEGAVKKLMAYRELLDNQINVQVAEKVLKDMFRSSESIMTPTSIIEETAKYFGLTDRDVKGQSKIKNVSRARQIAIYMIRLNTTLSLKEIGEYFSGRDHSTILSSIRKVEDSIAESTELQSIVKDITANLNARANSSAM